MTNLNFGQAIEYLKKGYPCARHGWNGKSMHVIMQKGSADFNNPSLTHAEFIDAIHHSFFESGDSGTITKLPTILLKTATGSIVVGWRPTLNDLFAEDWEVIGL